jgi:monothiol glutaredoxin
MNVHDQIDEQVKSNKIMLYMKGTPQFPQCGFSGQAAQILKACGAEFGSVDVLSNPDIRQGIKEYSNWPTIPQLYINGKFIGGADIMTELYQNGELQKLVEAAR